MTDQIDNPDKQTTSELLNTVTPIKRVKQIIPDAPKKKTTLISLFK